MPGVTGADVARESGVSRTTVSYVLNSTQGVVIADATRQRVRDAALRLGYAPSAAARTLRRGRSDLILCVLPSWPAGPVVDTLLDHLATELARRDLSVLVHHGRGPRPLHDLLRDVTPRAVVGFTPFTDDDERTLRLAGVEVLRSGISDEPDHRGTQTLVGRLQVRHLVDRGHRRIGYAMPMDARLAELAGRRLAGVRLECADHGLAEPVVRLVDLEVSSAVGAVRAWRSCEPAVSAVAAYDDEVALAVLAGLREERVRVPDGVAVIGVDDIPAGRLADSALSTIAHATDGHARHLAALVVAGLDGRQAPAITHEPLDLIVRAST